MTSNLNWKKSTALFLIGQCITLFGSMLVHYADIIAIDWLLIGTGIFVFLMGFIFLLDKTLLKAGISTQKSA